MTAHIHKFGFVVRHSKVRRAVTGCEPEPWHLRCVGTDVARHLRALIYVATLEQLFVLPAAPRY